MPRAPRGESLVEEIEDCVACLRELCPRDLLSSPAFSSAADVEAIPRSEISDENRVVLDGHIVEHAINEEVLWNALQALQRIAQSRDEPSAGGSSAAARPDLFGALARNDVPLCGLVSILYRLAEKVGRRVATLAARCYFAILAVPAADAYCVLFPLVLRACLRPVREAAAAGERRACGKGKENAVPADPLNVPLPLAGGRGGKGKGKAPAAPESDEEAELRATGGEGGEGKGAEDAGEAAREVLREVRAALGRYPLAGDAGEAVAHLVEALVPASRLPADAAPPARGGARGRTGEGGDPCEGPSTSSLAFAALAELCRTCATAPALAQVGRALVPSVAMTHVRAVQAPTVPHAILAVRARALDFLLARVAPLGEPGRECLEGVVRQLCAAVPDRAAYRDQACRAVARLLRSAPAEWAEGARGRFDAFLRRLSRHPRGPHRLFAVELAGHLWAAAPRAAGAGEVPAELQVVMSRLSDKAPAVRAKALAALAVAVQHATADEGAADAMRAALVAGRRESLWRVSGATLGGESAALLGDEGEAGPRGSEGGAWSEGRPSGPSALGTPVARGGGGATYTPYSAATSGAHGQPLLALLRRRALDDRPLVRRAALQVVEALAAFEPGSVRAAGEEEEARLFVEACSDAALSVRRQGIACLSAMLRAFPADAALAAAWAEAVLPAVADGESGALRERCAELVDELLLSAAAAGRGGALLAALDADSARFVRVACRLLHRAGRLPPALAPALLDAACCPEPRKGVCLLAATVSDVVPGAFDVRPLLEQWGGRPPAGDGPGAAHLLRLVANCAGRIPAAAGAQLAAGLLAALDRFEMGPDLAHAALHALARLHEARGGPAGREAIGRCAQQLLASTAAVLLPYAQSLEGPRPPPAPPALARHLFTLGELALMGGAGPVPEALVTAVQAVIAAPPPAEEDEGGEGEDADPAAVVRAHAFLALGKLCIRDEALAKRSVPALVRELGESPSAAVRNNVLLCMTDLCVRYTALVDQYMPRIALLLRDRTELLRRHALLLLSSLLHADYVKWRHELFFRFLFALQDPSPAIRACARRVLQEVGARKQPIMVCSHFVEAVYHLNGCTAHPAYNQFAALDGPAVRSAFDLASRPGAPEAEGNEQRRWAIYEELLRAMAEEQRLTVAARLTSDVLAPAADGAVPLDAPGFEGALADALRLLAARELRVGGQRPRGEGEAEGDGEEEAELAAAAEGEAAAAGPAKAKAAAAAAAAARAKLLATAARKAAGENAVPALVALRAVLRRARSPLQGALHACLREVVRAHALDLAELLAHDARLAAEIEYDLRGGGPPPAPAPPPGDSGGEAAGEDEAPRRPAKGKGPAGRAARGKQARGGGRSRAAAGGSDEEDGGSTASDGGEGERRRAASLSLAEREGPQRAPGLSRPRRAAAREPRAPIDTLEFASDDDGAAKAPAKPRRAVGPKAPAKKPRRGARS